VLGDVDQVLVMSVNPGFGGQKFIPGVLGKVAEIRRRIDAADLPVELEIDGGIGPGSAGAAARAGANVLVAGTSVFRSPDYAAAIAGLRKEADAERG
jgi:ribulose-phosphate 3-epimerase